MIYNIFTFVGNSGAFVSMFNFLIPKNMSTKNISNASNIFFQSFVGYTAVVLVVLISTVGSNSVGFERLYFGQKPIERIREMSSNISFKRLQKLMGSEEGWKSIDESVKSINIFTPNMCTSR